MAARPRAEILSDLRAILAELDACLHGEAKLDVADVSPRLREALARPSVGEAVREGSAKHEESAALPKAYAPPSREYTSNAKAKRPRDYVPDDGSRDSTRAFSWARATATNGAERYQDTV